MHSVLAASLYAQSDYDAAVLAVPITAQRWRCRIECAGFNQSAQWKVDPGSAFHQRLCRRRQRSAAIRRILETCLKLIHLYFTKPQLDEAAVAGMLSNTKVEMGKRYDMPANILMDSINGFLSGHHWRTKPHDHCTFGGCGSSPFSRNF